MTTDQEIVLFYYRLGVAISEWAAIENGLRYVMTTGFDNARLNREALSVGFFSLEGFRAKLVFADGVVSRKLAGSTHREDWKKLVDRAHHLSRQRNKLAHWTVGKYWKCPPGRRIALIPWVIKKSPKKTKVPRPPNGSLCIRDVTKLGMEFLALARSLENYVHRLIGQTEPHPKSDEQAGKPPTIAQLTKEIREAFDG